MRCSHYLHVEEPNLPYSTDSKPYPMHRNAWGIWEIRAKTSSATSNAEATVYVTRTGKKYHRDGCRYLSSSKIRSTLQDAVRAYGPCSVCKPPVATVPASAQTAKGPGDGKTATPKKPPVDPLQTVYVTKTGTKYHRAGCRYLSKSSVAKTLKTAATRYSACSVCKPPKP